MPLREWTLTFQCHSSSANFSLKTVERFGWRRKTLPSWLILIDVHCLVMFELRLLGHSRGLCAKLYASVRRFKILPFNDSQVGQVKRLKFRIHVTLRKSWWRLFRDYIFDELLLPRHFKGNPFSHLLKKRKICVRTYLSVKARNLRIYSAGISRIHFGTQLNSTVSYRTVRRVPIGILTRSRPRGLLSYWDSFHFLPLT